jgi:LacI family transcriptional regulator
MIAYDTPLTHMQDRIQGYKDALKEAGIRFRSGWLKKVPYLNYKEHVAEAIAQMLKNGEEVEALVFATNSISVQALKIIHARGIKVPDDLRIISFDESDAFEFFYATITYIKQNLNEISEKAVQVLIKNINAAVPKTARVIVPSSIVLGESSK